ncbi:MAG: hypothetical protein Ta2D_10890 [Rickettsiales bacterium]|nr:MAG: hypothetical protein Ta2D_10890 [Rickettsiales bacterium]
MSDIIKQKEKAIFEGLVLLETKLNKLAEKKDEKNKQIIDMQDELEKIIEKGKKIINSTS